jgi:hypothetical protein
LSPLPAGDWDVIIRSVERLARWWRWQPQSALSVVVQRLVVAGLLLTFSTFVLRDASYGFVFAASWVAVGMPLDLVRLRRRRREQAAATS